MAASASLANKRSASLMFARDFSHLQVWRYFRTRDLFQVAMAMTAVCSVVALQIYEFTLALLLGSSYGVFFLLSIRAVWASRRERDVVQRHVLQTLFSDMHQRILKGWKGARFTFFAQLPGQPRAIVPWYRFDPADPLGQEAIGSRARYEKGEGITGSAWAHPGVLYFAIFPKFETHEQFVQYYSHDLGIRASTARSLSPYMQDVRGIFAYAFPSASGEAIGVLSLDLQGDVSIVNKQIRIGDHDFDASALAAILQSTARVLSAFER